MNIFGIGLPEMVVILVAALVFIGPDKLPELARTAGGLMREINKIRAESMAAWNEVAAVGDTVKETVASAAPSSPRKVPEAMQGGMATKVMMVNGKPIPYAPSLPPRKATPVVETAVAAAVVEPQAATVLASPTQTTSPDYLMVNGRAVRYAPSLPPRTTPRPAIAQPPVPAEPAMVPSVKGEDVLDYPAPFV